MSDSNYAALDVNLSVQCGRMTLGAEFLLNAPVTCARGPSASGKSSLIRAILGVEKNATGTIAISRGTQRTPYLDSAKAMWLPPWQRAFGWVPQDALLLPNKSIEHNLRFPARAREADVEKIAAMTRVTTLLDRYPANLSGGERQRVALARALMSRPDMLILDEPFTGLDDALKSEVIDNLIAHCRTTMTTLFVVTHDADVRAQLAGDELVIRNGHVVRDGVEHASKEG